MISSQQEDYCTDVDVFTEDKLGLTLKSQELLDPLGNKISVTIVKSTIFSVGQISHQIRVRGDKLLQLCVKLFLTNSLLYLGEHEGDVLQSVNGESITNLQFQDVLRILKIAPRPIRLRFRTRSTLQGARSMSGSGQLEEFSRQSSRESGDSDLRLLLPERFGQEEDRNDSDSQDAVMSESFGDVDSMRSTENSSVVTEVTDIESVSNRQSSRLAAFLRKPFRRGDGFDGARWELRLATVPAPPRTEISLNSPSKAAISVRWRVHPKAVSYHLQFSRDWTMKVWKNWSERPRRPNSSERELVTTIFGLDFSKSYVVRVRYEFGDGQGFGDWSSPSAPIATINQVDALHHRVAQPAQRRR
ncbi:hypothetical protein PsorP6_013779 [Peronosclerospora sorghi]|uniref:Uncharacterized protein n=1 Tax=Peronosclerospora sorghi TaxID=230839 RepID=A0ACC0VHF1_9STRA|nr:hypothetical protein PsorP6_013779 [Peronosclerospora sorghi]